MRKIIALGNFDGLHIGHMAVLRGLEEAATHCLLFDPYPQQLLGGLVPPRILLERDCFEILHSLNIEPIKLEFSKILGLSPERFVEEILCKQLSTDAVVCGYNFHFGANASGTAADLLRICEKAGISCYVANSVEYEGSPVSSTRVRKALSVGAVSEAAEMLGRAFFYRLPVIHGQAIGRTLGWPTANQAFPVDFQLPKNGVYASRAMVGGKVFSAMTNIGLRPTFNGKGVLSETHIFGFSGDLYGKEIKVELWRFLRDEHTFANIHELKKQLEKDAIECQTV